MRCGGISLLRLVAGAAASGVFRKEADLAEYDAWDGIVDLIGDSGRLDGCAIGCERAGTAGFASDLACVFLEGAVVRAAVFLGVGAVVRWARPAVGSRFGIQKTPCAMDFPWQSSGADYTSGVLQGLP